MPGKPCGALLSSAPLRSLGSPWKRYVGLSTSSPRRGPRTDTTGSGYPGLGAVRWTAASLSLRRCGTDCPAASAAAVSLLKAAVYSILVTEPPVAGLVPTTFSVRPRILSSPHLSEQTHPVSPQHLSQVFLPVAPVGQLSGDVGQPVRSLHAAGVEQRVRVGDGPFPRLRSLL